MFFIKLRFVQFFNFLSFLLVLAHEKSSKSNTDECAKHWCIFDINWIVLFEDFRIIIVIHCCHDAAHMSHLSGLNLPRTSCCFVVPKVCPSRSWGSGCGGRHLTTAPGPGPARSTPRPGAYPLPGTSRCRILTVSPFFHLPGGRHCEDAPLKFI